MTVRHDVVTPRNISTRRQMIARCRCFIWELGGRLEALRKGPAAGYAGKTGQFGKPTRTSLHQEAEFKANPQRIYEVLLDSKQFAACTGMPAEIDPKAGGAFSMFGGMIVGRNVELVPYERIVQAWRPTHWASGRLLDRAHLNSSRTTAGPS